MGLRPSKVLQATPSQRPPPTPQLSPEYEAGSFDGNLRMSKKVQNQWKLHQWFLHVRSISRRVGVSWFMGLGVWIWREAKMKECFDEISHRSGVINLAAYKEASWRTWWCRTKSLWNFPCTYTTTYIIYIQCMYFYAYIDTNIYHIYYINIIYIYMYYRNMFFFLTSRRGCMMIQPEEMCWKWRKDHSTVRHSTKSAWTVKHF